MFIFLGDKKIKIKNFFVLTLKKNTLKLVFADGGRSSVGRAPVCGTGCRRFEPDRPPQFLKAAFFSGFFL